MRKIATHNNETIIAEGIRPAISSLKQKYDTLLKEFTEQRGANLWHPYLGSGIGNGALVELADGRDQVFRSIS